MRVTKRICCSRDVEIEITGAEAVRAILDDRTLGWEPKVAMMVALHNVAGFFRKIPDAVITELNDKDRASVSDFFAQQAERFRPVQR